MASVYLDNKLVKQTDWKPISLPVCLSVYLSVSVCLDEVMASVYLDNKLVKQTDWKPISLPVCLPVCVYV